MAKQKQKKDFVRPRTRTVNAKDTAVTPVADNFSSRRLWLLLGVVVVVALAAILTVFRP